MDSCGPKAGIDMEEISKELEEIEAKYTPKINRKCPKIPISLYESLAVLSKEFDSLGLSEIDLQSPTPQILEQVVRFSRDLVHIHRNTLSLIKDKNIETVARDNKHRELYNKIDMYKDSWESLRESCIRLKNSKAALDRQVTELKELEKGYKNQIEHLKKTHSGKQQLFEHNLRKMQIEIDRLKEICGSGISSETTTNEVALKLLKKYKTNEEIYKSTIKTLQKNNHQLMEEILNLKEEIVLAKDD